MKLFKKVLIFCLLYMIGMTMYAEQIPNNEIWYEANEKLRETTSSYEILGLHINAFGVSMTSHTFSNGKGVITFDGDVTSIGGCAFYSCTRLTSITIPNSVTSIEDGAFSGCSGLTGITIPNSVTSIGRRAFYGCSGFTCIIVESGNTKYDSRHNCNAIIETATNTLIVGCQNTEILNSVTSIGSSAFSGCSSLTSITIPNSVTSIGSSAFSGCSSLTSITIPNSVTSIESYAFSGCSGLTSVEIPNSVTSIENRAFYECSGLTSITIPNSVITIGSYAFSGCSGLSSISIGNSVTSIESYAFSGCSGLTSITIPNSVTRIGYRAFEKCYGLTSIEIPNSVTSIEDNAFAWCYGLTSIKVNWSRPLSISNGVFLAININKKSCTLYVPKGTFQMYASAPVWMDFGNIKEFDDGEDVHYIAIKQAGGCVKQHVELGNTYQYTFETEDGWEINSVSFNGIDVTGQLYNGMYSTPIITGNSELNVVFRQMSDGVKDVSVSSDVKVRASGNVITVSGAKEDDLVEVYSFSGALMKRERGNARIILDAEGVYIVKVGKDSFKVRL